MQEQNFPEGRLNDDDEGELRVLVSVDDGNVRLDFGKPVAWISMPPEMCLAVAFALIKQAQQLMPNPPMH